MKKMLTGLALFALGVLIVGIACFSLMDCVREATYTQLLAKPHQRIETVSYVARGFFLRRLLDALFSWSGLLLVLGTAIGLLGGFMFMPKFPMGRVP